MRYLMQALLASLIVIGLVGCGGFDQSTEAYYKSQVSSHDAQKQQITRFITAIQEAAGNPAFASAKEEWLAAVTSAENKLRDADNLMQSAANDYKTDDKAKRSSLYNSLGQAAKLRQAARGEIDAVYDIVEQANKIASDPGRLTATKGLLQSYANTNLSRVFSTLDQAATDYPGKASWVAQQKEAMNDAQASIRVALAQIGGQDVVAQARILATANALTNRFKTMQYTAQEKVKELYYSWTKTLADMEIVDNGSVVQFQHKYVKNVIRSNGSHSTDEEWVNVNERTFEMHEANLGMAIESKALGKFDSEASKTVQHAGYNYMAKPGQSNQYGTWRTDSSGNSFWEFYGQYMFMQQLMWGNSYRPVYVTEYHDYRSSYDRGRPYYGTTTNGRSRYGSTGSATASRYSSSKYSSSRTVNNYRNYRSQNKGSTGGGRTSFSQSRYSNTGRQTAARQAAARSTYSSPSRSSGSAGGGRSPGGK